MPTIRFTAPLSAIGSWSIIRLPRSASAKLSSRGMVMVEGTMHGFHFQAALEPDGKGSHWLSVDEPLRKAARVAVGDMVELAIEPSREWPEPKVPQDVQAALAADSAAHDLWAKITPMARWDWIRWINSTGQPETRKRRIEVACSKLRGGSRRPCCFNRTECTEPSVSKGGVLLEPTEQSVVFDVPEVPNAQTAKQLTQSKNQIEASDYHHFTDDKKALKFLADELK